LAGHPLARIDQAIHEIREAQDAGSILISVSTEIAVVKGNNVKRVTVTFFLLVLFAMNCVPQRIASATIHNGFLKARDYLEMDSDGQRVYAMGILDGMYLAPFFGAPDDGKRLLSLSSCVEGMKASQVVAIVEKYIRDHPEHWHLSLHLEAYSGLRQACPVK